MFINAKNQGMAQVILFDGEARENLLPLTHLKPVCDLRIGLLTIREKWSHYMGFPVSVVTQDYLSELYPKEWFIISLSNMPDTDSIYIKRFNDFPNIITYIQQNNNLNNKDKIIIQYSMLIGNKYTLSQTYNINNLILGNLERFRNLVKHKDL